MARPMYLIDRELLQELHTKQRQGVPISKLLQQHNLDITHPTLSKLIMYYDAMLQSKDDEVGKLIEQSLFPDWLTNGLALVKPEQDGILQQPPEYRYEGKMPLGQWVKNEWAEV